MSDTGQQRADDDGAAPLSDEGGQSGIGRRTVAAGSGLIVFVFGIGVGILLTFSGHGLFAGHLSVVLTGFLIALVCVAVVGVLVFALRRPLMRYLFQVSNAQLEHIAGPLASVARHAVNRDPDSAVDAARHFAQIALARWSWLSTRRWIIASLTALIASLAALAGTALLFRQNELLAEQSVLLDEQIERLNEQNALIETDIQLAEAARSAAVLSEIGAVADGLGEATDALRESGDEGPYDPQTDLPKGLVNRIISVSIAARPYRYLDVARPLLSPTDAFQAAAPRRPDIEALQEQISTEPGNRGGLIGRPVSPERGLLLVTLYNSSVMDTRVFSFRGADFSFSQLRIPQLILGSYQFARLSQSDFSGIQVVETDFRAATLYDAVFSNAVIHRSDFSAIPGNEIGPPFGNRDDPARTGMTGIDFSDSAVIGTRFSGSYVQLATFDDAFLADVSFAGSDLAATTFRNAVLLDVDFSGADVRAVDLDGALVFSETFVSDLSAAAAPETFNPDRWTLEKATLEDVYQNQRAFGHIGSEVDESRVQGLQPWRLVRVADF